jgi:hypothetical protein
MMYEKLPSRTSIRLMRLLPGAANDPLVCRLEVADLESDDLEFVAVSYVWGNPAEKKPIQCMNETLRIPASLFSFLREARTEDEGWVGWADAVCINQSLDSEALQERAQQVEMMDMIFSKSSKVLVYLGEQPKGFEDFLGCLEALHDFGIENINMQMFNNPNIPKELANLRQDSPVWKIFFDITSRSWYQRVWIIQEYVLAKEVVFCIGDNAIDDPVFRATCILFEIFDLHLQALASAGTPEPIHQTVNAREARLLLNQFRGIYEQDRKIPLTDFLRATLQLNTTDARDRLYGGYGIIDRAIMHEISVDYEISVEVLSQRLSTLLIRDGHADFVLENCSGVNEKLATWCIDLNGRVFNAAKPSLSTLALSRTYGAYAASGTTPLAVTTTANAQVIVLSGCIIETIKSLTDPYPWIPPDSEGVSEWLEAANWIEGALLWLGDVFKLPSGHCPWDELLTQAAWTDPINIFWRTLMSNVVQAPPDISSWIQSGGARERYKAICPGPEFSEFFGGWLKIFRSIQEQSLAVRNVDISSEWYLENETLCNKWMPQMPNATAKRVGATRSSRLALLPGEADILDEICIFSGLKVPFVIRRNGPYYRIVGSCYLHGMMDGEALARDDWQLRDILID